MDHSFLSDHTSTSTFTKSPHIWFRGVQILSGVYKFVKIWWTFGVPPRTVLPDLR